MTSSAITRPGHWMVSPPLHMGNAVHCPPLTREMDSITLLIAIG